jgi:hypothetical protein
MFIVRTVYAYLPAAPPTPLIPLALTSNGRRGFVPTTVRFDQRGSFWEPCAGLDVIARRRIPVPAENRSTAVQPVLTDTS